RLQTDIVDLIEAALAGRLDKVTAEWDTRAAVGVVMAAGGYPGSYRKGDVISGLDSAFGEAVKVFHAGTSHQGSNVVTAGGRVLCVTALGDDIAAARNRSYAAAGQIHWRDCFYRRDIGHRAIEKVDC
ncbi:MAG TPA: phosphoribosylglycinamide synthetase C domain-containing protein, partial [Gammaproteobacteria bacterium]|nr:phosphoribosylglycinamide synthetase C domain-containing protein [Gammaproteobacteria bacterium]